MQEEDHITATGNLHTKFSEDRSSSSRDMPRTHRQTHRQPDRNTLLPYWGGVTMLITKPNHELLSHMPIGTVGIYCLLFYHAIRSIGGILSLLCLSFLYVQLQISPLVLYQWA